MTRIRHRLGALAVAGLLAPASLASAQDPDDNSAPRDPSGQSGTVARMMKFDKDKDGKLTRGEITDNRLVRLFTRADANKDGIVTPTELEAVEAAERPAGGNAFGGPGGPGGPGGGPGGPGGPGGFMGAPPRPGEVLPASLRGRLKLTTEQQSQLDELQRDVDARMAQILNESQKAQLKQMATMRGPGGPGGPPPGGGRGRGPGGPGGPGGPPPSGDDMPPPGPPPGPR